MIETLISNTNTTDIKQLSGPETLPGLSRNGFPGAGLFKAGLR